MTAFEELDEAPTRVTASKTKLLRLKIEYKGDVYSPIKTLLRVKNASFASFADQFATPQFLLIRDPMPTPRR
jgi:hypothetical protein